MKLKNITPILNVTSVAASIAWFQSLGWKHGFVWGPSGMMPPGADASFLVSATFASVSSGEVEIFLCGDGQGSRGDPAQLISEDAGGVWMSWWLPTKSDVDAAHALAVSLGMIITQPPTDEPWGIREYHLRHPDGHTFRVSSGC